MKNLFRNPYPGDQGELLPRTAQALNLAAEGDIGGAQVALCAALAKERLLVPAPAAFGVAEQAKAQLGELHYRLNRGYVGTAPASHNQLTHQAYSRFVGAAGDSDASEQQGIWGHDWIAEGDRGVMAKAQEMDGRSGCAAASLGQVFSPVGSAVVAYSSAAVFQKRERNGPRPVLMKAQRVALDVLTGEGLLWLDPVQIYGNKAEGAAAFRADVRAGGGIILGRPALVALASGDRWLAPWDDPDIPGYVIAGLRHSGAEYLRLSPLPGAGLAVSVRVSPDLAEAKLAVKRAAKALARIPQLTTRTGFLQLFPVASA